MRKTIRCLLGLALLAAVLILTGCGSKSTEGIGSVGGKQYYTILMQESEISEYFTVKGTENMISVLDTTTGKKHIVKYVAIEEGGWIAYVGNRVRYISDEFSTTAMKTAASGLKSSSSYMTVEEAKKYIPWLGE